MPRLIAAFLRHGDYKQLPGVPSALQAFGLTDTGQKQALQGALEIHSYCQQQSLHIHHVIDSSTLLRAWQTASIIKTRLKEDTSQVLSIESHDDLCERSVGSMANLNTLQIETILHDDPRFETPPPNWKSNSHYCLPFQGAESLLNAGSRVAKHIHKSLSRIKPQITRDTLKIFVGHGASFRHAAHHLGLLEFAQIAQLSMFHARPVFLEFQDDLSYKHINGEWKIRAKEETSMD